MRSPRSVSIPTSPDPAIEEAFMRHPTHPIPRVQARRRPLRCRDVTGRGRGSASDPATAGGIPPDQLAARAAGAWRELRPGAAEPDGIEMLRLRSATGRKVVFGCRGSGLADRGHRQAVPADQSGDRTDDL